MADNYKFNPTTVATAVNKKLAIKKMPQWAQNIEQIQKFFDDSIQYWFTPEQRKSLDGYIGDRSSQAAFNKVFINEVSKEREIYQLIPAMVSMDEKENILAKLTYQDLVDSLGHYGAQNANQSRLLEGRFYSWAPPVNPDMIINFSNYYWDTSNIPTPDYIVSQRGAIDGNAWSRFNYWYHINETDSSGNIIITPDKLSSGRFIPARRPIIQYIKNIELLNHGRIYRGEVDVVCDTIEPEDLMLRPTSDNIVIDGVFLRNDMRVLFTNINNNGENNRVYRVVTKVISGIELYSVTLDPDFADKLHVSGEPKNTDSYYVVSGTNYGARSIHWDTNSWILSQHKETRNQYPLFNLYDYKSNSLLDDVVYPNSTFLGSSLFQYKTNPLAQFDTTLGLRADRDSYQQFIFDNTIASARYYSGNDELTSMRFFNIINNDYESNKYELYTDWQLSSDFSKQYVKQTFRPEVKYHTDSSGVVDPSSQYYEATYELAMLPDSVVDDAGAIKYDMRVEQHGFFVQSDLYNVTVVDNKPYVTLLVDQIDIIQNELFSVETHSRFNTPNMDIGAYEVPLNLVSNAQNEPITDIAISAFFNHFIDIIEHQDNFSGNPNGINNFWNTDQDMTKGRLLIQNEGSLLPLMIHNIDDNLNLVDATIYSQYEYNRFKNKFKNTVNMLDNTGMLTRVNSNGIDVLADTPRNLVRSVIQRINIGKNNDMAFAFSGMASTPELTHTFIPATPQYMGISDVFRPNIHVPLSLEGAAPKLYNITHTGALSLSFNQDMNDTSEYTNRLDIIFLALESMIYDSINAEFTNVDYQPRLSVSDVKPSAFRITDYASYTDDMMNQVNEWDNFALIGFANWAASNDVNLGTPTVSDDWHSWNWSTTQYNSDLYINQTKSVVNARGNWRGIYLDFYETCDPNTRPWEMLGFSQKPAWWDTWLQADGTTGYERVTIDAITYYIGDDLWGQSTTVAEQGDLIAGRIRQGAREGIDVRYARNNNNKFFAPKPHTNFGELQSPFTLGLVTAEPQTDFDKSTPWQFGDVSPIEFSYMNSNLATFDVALSVYRARPAEFSNYFWNSTEFSTFDFSGNVQWMKSNGTDRILLNTTEIVHGEDNNEVIGYQQWVSDNLRKDHKNVTTYYGNVVRSASVRLAYRLGGFGKLENLTFISDSFGLVSHENQHITLNKSAVRRQETLSGVKVTWDGAGYVISGYDSLATQFSYLTPVKTGKKSANTISNRSFVTYREWNKHPSIIPYNARLKNRQEVFDFMIGYGLALESNGWIFETIQADGSVFNWESMATQFVSWSQGNITAGEFIALSPATKTAKFGAKFGAIDSVTQYSGGTWALMDENNDGIYPYEIDTARIGNVMTVRVGADVNKRIMLLRLNIREFEHMIVFDNNTIFNDIMYSPQYGLYQDKLRVVGVITDAWNGRLEAPGFMVTPTDTLPGFEKLVDDFRHYYDNEDPTSSVQLNNLARHMIGFQTRDYLSELILNPKNQVDFYKGFIKEKGTFNSFDKILRTSKSLNTANYRTLEEWAIKIGEYGNLSSNQKLQFIVRADELKQNPQIIAFDSSAQYESDKDDTITYYGARGVDPRWITRSSDQQKFPFVDPSYFNADLPSAGPVTLADVDLIAENYTVLATRRKAYEANTASLATRVWLLENSANDWEVYTIDRLLDTKLVEIRAIPLSATDSTQVASTLVFSTDHKLVDGHMFFVQGESAPSAVTNERFFTQVADEYEGTVWNPTTAYSKVDPFTGEDWIVTYQNRTYTALKDSTGAIPGVDTDSWNSIFVTREITVNAILTPATYDDNNPILAKYRIDYGNFQSRVEFVNSRIVPVVNTTAFNRPVLYNQVTNKTETYLNLWDPIRGVVPGIASTEVTYTMQSDPALYNSNDTSSAAWGVSHVGQVWWDTSTAKYLEYTQPIRNANGSENEVLTRKYRRDNWGKLLPGSSVTLKEWVKSPVAPNDWATYVTSQALLDKDASGYVASGVADVDNWSTFDEYNSSTGVTKTYYYFWVENAIYVPQVHGRTRPISELERIIENPTAEGFPWFAPIGDNEFICSGFQNVITNNESVLQLTYSKNPDLEINDHKEWGLYQERADYNFNNAIWERLFFSLTGQEVINNIAYPIVYPHVDLGNDERNTWFKDINGARREFVAGANSYYKTKNITSDITLMSTVFNYKNEPQLTSAVSFNIVDVDNELVIELTSDAMLVENDSVLLYTSGTLPAPLSGTLTYFMHVRNDGYYSLKTVPTQPDSTGTAPGIVTIVNKGIGEHSLVKSDDIGLLTTDYLVMPDFWEFVDWYAAGYSELTPYVDVSFLPNEHNSSSDTVYRIFDNFNLWTLYKRNYTRDIPYWETVGRQNGTLQLNDKLLDDHTMYVNDTVTDSEQVIIDAINLLANTFDGAQSKIVFDMLYYVHQEQAVVDWVFKTSYIYVFGIEQVLSDRYTVQLDQVDHVIEYFKEAKPYRTKIRSAVEQKTSDTDTIVSNMIDSDPSPVDQALYALACDAKADGAYTGTEPRLRFRQQTIQLFFDRVGCDVTANPDRNIQYVTAFRKFSQTSNVSYDANNEVIEPGNPYLISEYSMPKPNTSNVNAFYQTMFDTLQTQMNALSPTTINETEWESQLPNFTGVASSVTYMIDYKFVNVCYATWGVRDPANPTHNEQYQKEFIYNVLKDAYTELTDLVTYLNQANRYILSNNFISTDELSAIMNCEFQGTVIQGSPQTRLPLGYSGNSYDDEGYFSYIDALGVSHDAYNSYTTTLYDHMLSRGIATKEELVAMGFLNRESDLNVIMSASLNDRKLNRANPLLNDDGAYLEVTNYSTTLDTNIVDEYYDDQNAYGSAGYEENIMSHDIVASDAQYVFNMTAMRDAHSELSSKFVTFSGLPAPALTGIMDFGSSNSVQHVPKFWNDRLNIDSGLPIEDRGLFLYDAALGDTPWDYVYIKQSNYANWTLTSRQEDWIKYRNVDMFNAEVIDQEFNVYFDDTTSSGTHVINYGLTSIDTRVLFDINTAYAANDIVWYNNRFYATKTNIPAGEFDIAVWYVIEQWQQKLYSNVVPADHAVDYNGVLYFLNVAQIVKKERFNQNDGWTLAYTNQAVLNDDTSKFNFDFGRNFGDPELDFGTLEVQGFVMQHPTNKDEVVISVPSNIKDIATGWRTNDPDYIVTPDQFLHKFQLRGASVDYMLIDATSDLAQGDKVILTSADPVRDPTEVTMPFVTPYFNKPEFVYTVRSRRGVFVQLQDAASNIVLFTENPDFPYTEYTDSNGNTFADAKFAMVKINPAPLNSVASFSNMNYDAFYGRYLNSAGFVAGELRMSGNSIISVDHGFADLDPVKFNTFKIGADIGEINITDQLFVRVIDVNTFEVFASISDAVTNVNVMRPGVDINLCTVSRVDFWYTGTVTTLQVDPTSVINPVTPEADIRYESISLGFARPGIDTGSTEELIKLQISEHVSITIMQDDRVYSVGNPNVDGVYSSGAEPSQCFVYRLDKGSDEVEWNVRLLKDSATSLLTADMFYNETEFTLVNNISTGDDMLFDVGSEYMKVFAPQVPTIDPILFTNVLTGMSSVPYESGIGIVSGVPSNPVYPTFEDVVMSFNPKFAEFYTTPQVTPPIGQPLPVGTLIEGTAPGQYSVLSDNTIRYWYAPSDVYPVSIYGLVEIQIESVGVPYNVEFCEFSVNGTVLLSGIDFETNAAEPLTVNLLTLYPAGTELHGVYIAAGAEYVYSNIRRGEHGSPEGGVSKRHTEVVTNNSTFTVPLDLAYHAKNTNVLGLFSPFTKSLAPSFTNANADYEYTTSALYELDYEPNNDGDYVWGIVSLQQSNAQFARELRSQTGSAGSIIAKQ